MLHRRAALPEALQLAHQASVRNVAGKFIWRGVLCRLSKGVVRDLISIGLARTIYIQCTTVFLAG